MPGYLTVKNKQRYNSKKKTHKSIVDNVGVIDKNIDSLRFRHMLKKKK